MGGAEALFWPLGGQLWPAPASARDRSGWLKAKGAGQEVSGHQWRGALGHLSGHNVLDCSMAWLADREQWLAEGMGSLPTRGEGSLAWAKDLFLQPVLPPWARRGLVCLGGRQRAWHPVGASTVLPYPVPQFPHTTTNCQSLELSSTRVQKPASTGPAPSCCDLGQVTTFLKLRSSPERWHLLLWP